MIASHSTYATLIGSFLVASWLVKNLHYDQLDFPIPGQCENWRYLISTCTFYKLDTCEVCLVREKLAVVPRRESFETTADADGSKEKKAPRLVGGERGLIPWSLHSFQGELRVNQSKGGFAKEEKELERESEVFSGKRGTISSNSEKPSSLRVDSCVLLSSSDLFIHSICDLFENDPLKVSRRYNKKQRVESFDAEDCKKSTFPSRSHNTLNSILVIEENETYIEKPKEVKGENQNTTSSITNRILKPIPKATLIHETLQNASNISDIHNEAPETPIYQNLLHYIESISNLITAVESTVISTIKNLIYDFICFLNNQLNVSEIYPTRYNRFAKNLLLQFEYSLQNINRTFKFEITFNKQLLLNELPNSEEKTTAFTNYLHWYASKSCNTVPNCFTHLTGLLGISHKLLSSLTVDFQNDWNYIWFVPFVFRFALWLCCLQCITK